MALGIALVVGGCGTPTSERAIAPPATVPAPNGALPAASPSAAHPCGTTTRAPQYRHVVWIIMENRGLNEVAHSPSAPYLASLARACGLATHYAGVAHPSLPNYIALTSGSTHGISDDGDPSSHRLTGPSIFSLLGAGWRSLEESMPTNCDQTASGEYAPKHNPAAYYTSIASACAHQDVPLLTPPDLSRPFTLITPNLCHDMHDCSTATGDAWLGHEVPQILDSPAYRSGTTALFVTWDENDAGGSLVPTYVVAPSVPAGARVGVAYTHYSLLRTTEMLLGIHPLLGRAATATPMLAGFHL